MFSCVAALCSAVCTDCSVFRAVFTAVPVEAVGRAVFTAVPVEAVGRAVFSGQRLHAMPCRNVYVGVLLVWGFHIGFT